MRERGISQEVVVGVGAHEHEILETLHNALLNQLEENVVAPEHKQRDILNFAEQQQQSVSKVPPFVWLLVSHTRPKGGRIRFSWSGERYRQSLLFQEVNVDVTTSQLSHVVEVAINKGRKMKSWQIW